MFCVRSYSYSIVIKGLCHDYFTHSRRLQQGDLLSSYLVILVVDNLATMLHKAAIGNLLHGFQLSPQCPSFTHLFFCDDNIFFLRASETNAFNFKVMSRFLLCLSGQLINFDKSRLIFSSNTSVSLQISIHNFFLAPILP